MKTHARQTRACTNLLPEDEIIVDDNSFRKNCLCATLKLSGHLLALNQERIFYFKVFDTEALKPNITS